MENIQYLQTDELLKVLAEAKRQGPRAFCLTLLAYRHGLRASEISLLKIEDVRGGKIDVRRLKGSLHTIQPLQSHDNLLLDEKRALAAWLRVRGEADGSQLLFTSRQGSGLSRRQIYNIFEDVAMRAGIESGRRDIKILKHSLGSHLIRGGASVAYVQMALGHKDPGTTLRYYTHINQTETATVIGNVLGSVFAPA